VYIIVVCSAILITKTEHRTIIADSRFEETEITIVIVQANIKYELKV